MREAQVTINNVQLDAAQVMALRVAVSSWITELCRNDRLCKDLGEVADLYKARLREVERLLVML
jgi:hypothetical protein